MLGSCANHTRYSSMNPITYISPKHNWMYHFLSSYYYACFANEETETQRSSLSSSLNGCIKDWNVRFLIYHFCSTRTVTNIVGHIIKVGGWKQYDVYSFIPLFLMNWELILLSPVILGRFRYVKYSWHIELCQRMIFFQMFCICVVIQKKGTFKITFNHPFSFASFSLLPISLVSSRHLTFYDPIFFSSDSLIP